MQHKADGREEKSVWRDISRSDCMHEWWERLQVAKNPDSLRQQVFLGRQDDEVEPALQRRQGKTNVVGDLEGKFARPRKTKSWRASFQAPLGRGGLPCLPLNLS